jgi:hypothetical protein
MVSVWWSYGVLPTPWRSRHSRPQVPRYRVCLRWLWLQKRDLRRLWSLLPMHEDKVSKAFFRASTVIVLGNGNRISFWQDPWFDGCCIAELAPDLYHAPGFKMSQVQDVKP